VEFPPLSGKPEGYIATAYDPDGNASVNNITVTAHADDGGATLATIDDDGGRVWFRVVSGAWEQQGRWPEPPAPATSYATWASTRRALTGISLGGGATAAGGTSANFIDGAYGEHLTDASYLTSWGVGAYITLDMAAPVICDGMRVYVGDNSTWPAGTYTQIAELRGSNDPAFGTYEVLATGIELANGGHVVAGGDCVEGDTTDGVTLTWRREYAWATPATAYQYYRLFGTAGAGMSWWYTCEYTFKVSA